MSVTQHRFQTLNYSGSVRLTETGVMWTLREGFDKWERVLPYHRLCPFPIRAALLNISFGFWLVAGIGLAGTASGIWGILDNEGTNMTATWASVLANLGMIVFVYALLNVREKWIYWPVQMEGYYISYPCNGPDRRTFELFSEELQRRIESSQRWYRTSNN